MLRDALAAPARTQDAATTVFIGGILMLVTLASPVVWWLAVVTTPLGLLLTPLFVLPPLVLRGYDVRVVRAGLAGESAAPSFLDWDRLVRDGAQAALLGVVYAVPLIALVVVGAVLTLVVGSGVVAPNTAAGAGAALGIVAAALGAVAYSVLYLYLRPAVVVVFASEGRLRDALAVRTVLGVAGSGRYVKGWLLAVGALAVGVTIGLPLTAALVGVVVLFYARVVAQFLYGRSAGDVVATDDEPAVDPLASRPPAEAAPAVQTGRTVALAAAGGRSEHGVVTVAGDGGDAAGPGGQPESDERATEVYEEATPFRWVGDSQTDERTGE